MPNPPQGARIYLYACLAGERLARFLRRCEAFGHSDVVPMPLDGAKRVVLRYLDEVDRLMRGDEPIGNWRKRLGRLVNEAYALEVERPTGLLNATALLMLRRSLGYVDE
jgi:hypothetical protein